jgi:hypothetical protein
LLCYVCSYELSTPESQTRQLADLAFVMQDYDLALSQLKNVASEYKADKAAKHFASSQELIGICTLLTGGSHKDANAAFDSAMGTYHAAGDIRRGTRAALWAYDMHRWSLRFSDGATFLLRASEKEPAALAAPTAASSRMITNSTNATGISSGGVVVGGGQEKRPDPSVRGALLLEQAAYCFVWMKPPLVRKYAFHLVMAAHWYHKCNQVPLLYFCMYLSCALMFMCDGMHGDIENPRSSMLCIRAWCVSTTWVVPCGGSCQL